MTIAESLAFIENLQTLAGNLLDALDVILCPPFTALSSLADALEESPIQLGAQNMALSTDPTYTGQISAALLADVGCHWVMLGHWEVRRHLGDDDTVFNLKVHLAFEAGLAPILFIGEAHDEAAPFAESLEKQLVHVLEGCTAEQVAATAPAHVEAGCVCIRSWLRREWGEVAAEQARIVYGGSVAPKSAPHLLACLELDGLATTRRGRDPVTFAEIVHLIARERAG